MKRQLFIFGATMFAVFAAWYAWWIRPQQVRLDTAEEQIRAMLRRAEAATVEKTRLDNLRLEIVRLDSSVKQLESRLYERPQLPNILRRIAALGERYGLKFSAIYPKYDELLQEMSSEGTPLMVLPVEIQADGEYVRFGRFVEQLDKQDFLFSIERMDLSLTRDSYPLIRVTMQGNLFLRREATRAGIG